VGGPTAAGVLAALEDVRGRIAATGRDPAAVRVVAVTKGHGADAVAAALAAGLADVGESYAQELLAKRAELGDAAAAARWHLIGRLQTNKVRALAGTIALWQSVDRLALGRELARRDPGAAVLVQVDVAGLPGRGGVPEADAAELVGRLRELGLDVRGFMAVGPPGPPDGARAGFRRVVRLADELALPERSLGMSGDLEVAVEEGATMVRVGTALFGARS
jgi:pyridoxal phosphate enzyme (YggS family)